MATEGDPRHVNDETPRERFYRRERQSVPAARAFVSAALADWGIGVRAYEITLCVSELATNALLHGVPAGRGFRLCLSHGSDVLRVEVHDSGDGWPRFVGEGDADESGRGLLLVAALADKWGVMERDPGKIVWCEFAQESSSTSASVAEPSRTSR
ncbi:ATP-binding protein [Streptomyces sp. NBC_01283]|uniref:ATP-binding protein n=1 Tax=Streptomyces sp. NBC_01283 TaxID=2903812 RepID=UPI00352E1AFA|nr:ATP-binding protein [Streptomyces sp. NBC_01283]